MRLASESHRDCVICGVDDPLDLGLEFQPGPGGEMSLIFDPKSKFQGYNDRLHGGIISLLFDAVMTHCLFSLGINAVTGALDLRFLHPVRTCLPVNVKARVKISHPPLFVLEGILRQENKQLVRATGKFMNIPHV